MIGNTLLIPVHFEAEDRTVWGKCEFLNPSGSIKDRLARTIVLDAEARVVLDAKRTILECTSANTGIAFAMVGSSSGANMAAGLRYATTLPKEAVVVTILCDRAERYFSTRLFNGSQ